MGRKAIVLCLLLRVGLLYLLYSTSFVGASSALVTSDCLYFTSSNGKVWIGQANESNFTESVLDSVAVTGLNPAGIAVVGEVAYVVSQSGIEYFNIVDLPHSEDVSSGTLETTILVQFSDFARDVFRCSPGGMRAYNNTLYIACASGIPYAVVRFSTDGDFLGGVKTYADTINTFDVLVIEQGSEAFLLLDDSTKRAVYISNITDNTNGTLQYSCFVCNFTTVQPGFSAEYRGLVADSNQSIVGVLLFTQSLSDLAITQNSLLLFTLNGSFIGEVYRQPNNSFTDTTTLCLSSNLQMVVVMQPVILEPGYVVGLYSPTYGDPFVAQAVGEYNAKPDQIFPQFCQFAQCPVYLIPLSTDSSSTNNSLTIGLVVGLVSFFFLLCCILLLLLLIIVFLKWRGRRREYEGEEMEQLKVPVNEEGWSYREIDPHDLQFDVILGSGAFGKVYKGFWRGAEVAIKTLESVSLESADEDMLNEIRSEAQVMARLGNHPNIVSFIGAVTKNHADEEKVPNKLCLVLEFCARGSLFDCLIKRKEKIPFATLVRMARDAANGILHCTLLPIPLFFFTGKSRANSLIVHKEKIIHRDIAARNILLGQNYEVYISDFGMARLKEEDIHTTQSNIGPIAWMAPESLLRREYSEASDAFSFGVLLWEMVARKQPWKGLQAAQLIIAVTKENTRLKIPSDCDPVIKAIILSVWKAKPEKRMKMKDIAERLNVYYDRLRDLYEVMHEEEDKEESSGASLDFLTDTSTGLSMKVLSPRSPHQQQQRPTKRKRKPKQSKILPIIQYQQPAGGGGEALLPMYDTIEHKDADDDGEDGEHGVHRYGDEEGESDSENGDNGDVGDIKSDGEILYTIPVSPSTRTEVSGDGYANVEVSNNIHSSQEKRRETEKMTDGLLPEIASTTSSTTSDEEEEVEETEEGDEVDYGTRERETASMIGQPYESIAL